MERDVSMVSDAQQAFGWPLVCLVAFLFGYMLIPGLAAWVLRYKAIEIDRWFDESLARYRAFVRATGRKPERSAGGDEKHIAAWADSQVDASIADKLSREKAMRLVDAGVIHRRELESLQPQATKASRYIFHPGLGSRMMAATMTAVSAAALMLLPISPFSSATVLLALATMEIVVICDMKARVIPWQLCCVMMVLACVWQVSGFGLAALGSAVFAALVMTVVLIGINHLFRTSGLSSAIGSGDMRIIPSICILSGFTGMLFGFVACALTMLIIALTSILFRHAGRRSYVPMAPGLAVWFLAGFSMQVANCI